MNPLASLHDLSLALGSSLDRCHECTIFVDWVEAELRPRFLALFVAESGRDSLRPLACNRSTELPSASLPLGRDPWGWLEEKRLSLPPGERYALPITLEGELFGLLTVISAQSGQALLEEQNLLDLALAYLAPILRNIERYENIERLVEERTEQLRASEQRFRTYLEQANDYIFTLDLQGRLTFANEALCAALGYRCDELLGQSVLNLLAPSDRPIALQALERIWQGETVDTLEIPIPTNRGEKRIIQIRGRSICQNGQLIETLHIARDVTVQRQMEEALRESEKRYRELVTTLPVMIYAISPDGKITFLNPAFEQISGWSVQEWLGRPFDELLYPEDRPLARERFHRALQTMQSRTTIELRLSTASGEIRTLDVFGIAQQEGGTVTGVTGYAHDITRRKQAEEESRRLNAELEQRVEERTRQLQEAQQQLLQQERLTVLGHLASSVAHELRNPLGVIANAIYYLRLILPAREGYAQVSEYLDILDHENRLAAQIVTDLLDYANTPLPAREPVAASELVRKVLERYPAPENVRVTLALPADLPSVYVDAQQIEQALGNVILNAYEAMLKGGELRVRSEELRVRSEELRVRSEELESASSSLPSPFIQLTVEDTGPGIPSENMPKIFEPLFTTKARGIGLGLAVSKKLIEANGGQIEVQSEPGKGAIFTLVLPTGSQVGIEPRPEPNL